MRCTHVYLHIKELYTNNNYCIGNREHIILLSLSNRLPASIKPKLGTIYRMLNCTIEIRNVINVINYVIGAI